MRSCGFKWVQSTVWNVEKGERPLRAAELKALADYFGIAPASLWASEEANQVLINLRQQKQVLEGIEGRLADLLRERVTAQQDYLAVRSYVQDYLGEREGGLTQSEADEISALDKWLSEHLALSVRQLAERARERAEQGFAEDGMNVEVH